MGVTIALFVASVIFVLVGLIVFKESYSDSVSSAAFIVGCVGLIGAVVFGACLYSWVGASNSAEFYNKEFGTSYTPSDFYWNSGIIRDKALPASWKRLDINASVSSDSSK